MGSQDLVGARAGTFVRHMEDQGATVRKTKGGYIVYSISGKTATVHRTYGDRRGMVNDIAQFRRAGLHHPEDTKEIDEVVERNEEGYPLYMVGPVAGTTRKKVLADLESKGWPVRVFAQDIALDTVTAARALYAVGYRWDPATRTKRKKAFVAPSDIVELHEKMKAEQARLAEEARQARLAAHQAVETAKEAVDDIITVEPAEDPSWVGHEATPGHSMQIVKTQAEPEPAAAEREFIDSVDSWTLEPYALPGLRDGGMVTVDQLISTLRAAGLEVEIRVWRAVTPKGN